MVCVSLTSFKILWNGEPTAAFKAPRGLRQGDPLSPYLFVLYLERLGHMIYGKVNKGFWKPITLSRGGPSFSHLCFADNLILLAKADSSQALIIRDTLTAFCSEAEQKISFTKSSLLVSCNVNPSFACTISNILQIPLAIDLGKYLGVPSIQKRVTKETY